GLEQELPLPHGRGAPAGRRAAPPDRGALQGIAVRELPRGRAAAAQPGPGQRRAQLPACQGAAAAGLDPRLAQEPAGADGRDADAQLLGLQRRGAPRLAEQAVQRRLEGADRRPARLPDAPRFEERAAGEDGSDSSPAEAPICGEAGLNKSRSPPVQALTTGTAFATWRRAKISCGMERT